LLFQGCHRTWKLGKSGKGKGKKFSQGKVKDFEIKSGKTYLSLSYCDLWKDHVIFCDVVLLVACAAMPYTDMCYAHMTFVLVIYNNVHYNCILRLKKSGSKFKNSVWQSGKSQRI
jgi:hypothetical protein